MPLPPSPTQKLARPVSKADAKANNELAIKGVLCVMIGAGVVLSPYFLKTPGMQGIVAQAAAVGWFALALGLALLGVYARRRLKGSTLLNK